VDAGRQGSALPVWVLLSTLDWQAYRHDRAAAVLEPALALAQREGHVRDFLEAGAALVPVLRSCAAQGIAPEWSNHLLAAWEATRLPSDLSHEGTVPGLREALSEREREVLGLLAQGSRTSRWRRGSS
jgi:LuxR family transcriptional regulator, maltose regulon positive regulatory protein